MNANDLINIGSRYLILCLNFSTIDLVDSVHDVDSHDIILDTCLCFASIVLSLLPAIVIVDRC